MDTVTRVSSSIYRVGRDTVSHHKRSGYLGCTCSIFAARLKCDHTVAVKKLLSDEGIKCRHRRLPSVPADSVFLSEPDRFRTTIEDVLHG